MHDAILDRDGRDERVGYVQELLRNTSRVGIEAYCWIWTASLTVLRTFESVRGGGRLDHYPL